MWNLLSEEEHHEARLHMQAHSFAKRSAGSITAAESNRLDAAYVCAEEMSADHELFTHAAFYSHELGHAVCGAPLAMEKRNKKQGWRHSCKSGQINPTDERGTGKFAWLRKEPKIFFRVCASDYTDRPRRYSIFEREFCVRYKLADEPLCRLFFLPLYRLFLR